MADETLEERAKEYDLKKEARELAAFVSARKAYVDDKDHTVNPFMMYAQLIGKGNEPAYQEYAATFQRHSPQKQAGLISHYENNERQEAVNAVKSKPNEAFEQLKNPASLYEVLINVNPEGDSDLAKLHKLARQNKKLVEDYESGKVKLQDISKQIVENNVDAMKRAGLKDFIIGDYVDHHARHPEEKGSEHIGRARGSLEALQGVIAENVEAASTYLHQVFDKSQDKTAAAMAEAIGNQILAKEVEEARKKAEEEAKKKKE